MSAASRSSASRSAGRASRSHSGGSPTWPASPRVAVTRATFAPRSTWRRARPAAKKLSSSGWARIQKDAGWNRHTPNIVDAVSCKARTRRTGDGSVNKARCGTCGDVGAARPHVRSTRVVKQAGVLESATSSPGSTATIRGCPGAPGPAVFGAGRPRVFLTSLLLRTPDPLALTGRTPSRRFDVVATTPAASFSPCAPPPRRLDALATNAR